MVVQEEKEEKKGWTTKNDPRVTPIGKFIRKTSIDELPQLFNILKGYVSCGTKTGTTTVCRKIQRRDPKIYDQTSGAAGTYRMGTK